MIRNILDDLTAEKVTPDDAICAGFVDAPVLGSFRPHLDTRFCGAGRGRAMAGTRSAVAGRQINLSETTSRWFRALQVAGRPRAPIIGSERGCQPKCWTLCWTFWPGSGDGINGCSTSHSDPDRESQHPKGDNGSFSRAEETWRSSNKATGHRKAALSVTAEIRNDLRGVCGTALPVQTPGFAVSHEFT